MKSEIEEIISYFQKNLTKLQIIVNICDKMTEELEKIKENLMTDAVLIDVDE